MNLPETIRDDVLRDARLSNIAPSIFEEEVEFRTARYGPFPRRGAWSTSMRAAYYRLLDERVQLLRLERDHFWLSNHRHAIANALLRNVDLLDGDIRLLVDEGSLETPDKSGISTLEMVFHFFDEPTAEGKIPLPNAAASLAIGMDLFLIISSAFQAYGLDIHPPDVTEVRPGSVNLKVVGSGLFTSGIAVVLAGSSGLVAPASLAIALGSTSILLGSYGIHLGWRKSRAEIAQIDAARSLTAAQTEGTYLDNELKRRQIRAQDEDAILTRPPSILVKQEQIEALAEQHRFPQGVVSHLINRGSSFMQRVRAHVRLEIFDKDGDK